MAVRGVLGRENSEKGDAGSQCWDSVLHEEGLSRVVGLLVALELASVVDPQPTARSSLHSPVPLRLLPFSAKRRGEAAL